MLLELVYKIKEIGTSKYLNREFKTSELAQNYCDGENYKEVKYTVVSEYKETI